MRQYLDALEFVLSNGKQKPDRTGVGTLSTFGYQMRFDLSKGFPAVTTKKLAWKAMVSELLWFLEGSSDERRLSEILHGTADSTKYTIWTANANSSYWKPNAKFNGDLGRVYGVQWRSWKGSDGEEIDQIKNLIDGIKNDPYSRRHIVTAWNVSDLSKMALPPCHVMSQFDVTDGKLSCHMYQRSADLPLGVPFNIASYSLLVHMIAQVCDLEVGELVYSLGDMHIYMNQIEGIKEQITREPLELPKLWIDHNIKDINQFHMNSFRLIDYTCHETIKMPMAV